MFDDDRAFSSLSAKYGETILNSIGYFSGENDESDRPRFERESTKLSEDFERHTQIPRDSDFAREQQPDGDDDMDDSQRDKAAIRIQASFRGYKTRKELNSTGSLDSPQQPPTVTSPHPHDEDDQDQRKGN